MELSTKELILVIILPIILCIAGIVVPRWLKRRQRESMDSTTVQGSVVGNIETGGGNITAQTTVVGKMKIEGGSRDVITGGSITIHKGLTREEAKEVAKEVVEEEFLKRGQTSPPVPAEELRREIESLKGELAQKDLEKAKLLSERGTERLKTENYEGAIEDLQGAIEILPEGSEASLSTHFNLGIALAQFPRGDRESNLKKAIESYKKILSFHTIEKTPGRYASAQNNLGIAYRGLSEVRDKKGNLRQAINAYNEALRVYTLERFPQDYAGTQNNLGNAYGDLAGVRDKESNLGLAIRAYQEALRVYTFDRFSQDYAMAQNNLGIAYRGLSEGRDKEANLGQAINAFKEALRVYTLDKFPQQYATTQNNLGTAYGDLAGVRDKEGNLARAIGCYTEALKVHTREAFPWGFVMASWNLALDLYMKGDVAGASRVMEGMLPVAEGVGHPGVGKFRQFYEGLKRQ